MRPERQTVGTTLTPELLKEVNTLQEPGEMRYEFWTRIVSNYIDAWTDGSVPRTYIGAAGTVGTTFQITKTVFDQLCKIAEADGVSNAMAVRTAAAYFVYGEHAKDPWGTHNLLPEQRRDILSA